MHFSPSEVVYLPEGQHARIACCVALVGKSDVAIRWAVRAMQIAFPVNAVRSLFCLAHASVDASRNLTLYHWSQGLKDPRHSWVTLVPVDVEAPWDVVVRGVAADVPVARVGECYVVRGDAIVSSDAPWFSGGAWRAGGVEVLDTPAEAAGGAPALPDAQLGSEAEAAMNFAVCIPSLGRTTMPWVAHAISLAGPMASSRVLIMTLGHEVGIARQRSVDAVLGMSPRPAYLLFYGDDMLPSVNAMMLLHDTMQQTGAKAVAGLYYMKMFPPAVPIIWKQSRPGMLQPGRDFALGDVIRVDGTGLDFVLFRTDALAAMPPLRFKTVIEWQEGRGLFMQTEDAFFWERWRETHGEGPLVDTRCRVGHYSALDGGVY